MKNEIIAPFAYDTLPDIARAALRASADRIRELVRRSTTDIIETGRELIAAKKKLGHGQFGGWLELELGINERTAQRYMQAAQWAEGKSDTVSVLEPTAVYLLSSPGTPDVAKAAIMTRIERGERVPLETIRTVVREQKEAARQAKEEEKRSPEARKREAQRKAKRQAERQKEQAERERKEAAADAAAEELIALLRARLGGDTERFIELARIADGVWAHSLSSIARRLADRGDAQ